jgi:hypothetical protein
MSPQASVSKPNGFVKPCRDCESMIYLHRGPSGPWRAYEPAINEDADEWNRHRCTAALQDAEILSIIAPPGSKPQDLIPKIRRLIQDLQGFSEQAERRLEVPTVVGP